MSRLLICGFGPFPGAPDNPAAETVRRLQARKWSPAGATAAYAVLPTEWAQAPVLALTAAKTHAADAILLVGVALGAGAFRVESLARNQASQVHPDAAGEHWPWPAIEPTGPETVAVTAPVEAMALAIAACGLAVERSADAGTYLCNFTLYRLLTEPAGPRVGFLHVPPVGEGLGLEQIEQAVRAAAQAIVADKRQSQGSKP